MTYIKLNNVGVGFSIYDARGRSIKNRIMEKIGGDLTVSNGIVRVEALNNVTFSLNDGDRLGLVGHNGAGKSTLLKVLAGIYEPIVGTIKTKGSVISLTDIAMGMDTESTGYENIKMRCIFMGMTFKQANDKVEEIADFSELKEYLHLPTRTYSSGMFLRLAFSVSTCIIPEILIMDELISTGDANFITKAQKRLNDIMSKTRIIILASHNNSILEKSCNRVIWMDKGTVKMDGDPKEVLKKYSDSRDKVK